MLNERDINQLDELARVVSEYNHTQMLNYSGQDATIRRALDAYVSVLAREARAIVRAESWKRANDYQTIAESMKKHLEP